MKTLIAVLVAAPATYLVGVEAQQVFESMAPQASATVSDISLKSMWTQAAALELDGVPFDEALQRVAVTFSNDTFTYRVEDDALIAESEWSCRRIFDDGIALVVVDC